MTSLMWFRDDLRLHDNQALSRAAEAASLGDTPLVAVVLDEPAYPGTRPLGGATTWWRERSLYALARDLADHGVELIRAAGDAREEIPRLAADLGATTVTWTRRYHGPLREVDAGVKETLTSQGITATSSPGFTLVEPWEVTNGQGQPYKVFTPFSKAAASQVTGDEPEGVPEMGASASSASAWPKPTEPVWAASLAEHWTPGEAGARERLAQLDLANYAEERDIPALNATSLLSPHLRFGEVSPREVWFAAAEEPEAAKFHSELLWRDFAWHRLYHLPNLATENVREKFDRFDWSWDDPRLKDWQAGTTGIPLVDAGMRELWATGYMHNRVRMVVGSFLTKNLGIHWRLGEEWFWDTLVDADAASNPFNWQWVAGCGDDAAPFFRIFNPETQAQRFDPDGEYVRRWAPALSAPPIVDLKESRQAALDAYAEIKD
ncbi:cryptochrome/photolyase family protein [Corynebacterium tuberculostearicum]|uniref:cryptochrome/photolyase family protein n=1 Tax=Corynebacterium tuberculostearicum TaxID=38304 RepID=UPI00254AA95C|nr:deoxyribodipyrimidine photo-lyase [Corynebacterium tuberculostearicum]MDK8676918.1 deoxyribodipyrimidine photo-lyase [Corynebacterium tuberculostearicum]